TSAINQGSEQYPVLSGSGNRAAFAMAPGTEDPARPNRIFVVNADGSGLHEVDSYTSFVFFGSLVDISADGSKVVSTEGVQIRIADAAGSTGRPLIALDSGEIRWVRISGD